MIILGKQLKIKNGLFVSDFARFKILYDFGGIYFDTDVEVVRNFDEIIAMGAFMGKKNHKTLQLMSSILA